MDAAQRRAAGDAMLKRFLITLALAGILALPFVLRPRHSNSMRADDTLVVITPHNEAIRFEFERGFSQWYHAATGRTVRIDWRAIEGTSDIARYLESAYLGAFATEWTSRRHRSWNADVESAIKTVQIPADAQAREARQAFLASNVSCGIDVFFGGDVYEFGREAALGRLVDSGLRAKHPDWFRADIMPEEYRGERFRDADGRWFGAVLSQYGMVYDRDSLRRLGVAEPTHWRDMADPRLAGEVGLADPTRSGSVCEAFENMIQRQIQHRQQLSSASAIADGWTDGLRMIQAMGANARYFTDSSQKPPIDVANGDCAVGLCIDFYGRQQQEAVRRRARSDRIGYVSPRGGSAASTDPIGLLRGAPHRDVAVAFIEYVLSPEGQKLWAFRPGAPGGPARFALRRMPIRRDFYRQSEWRKWRSDPEDDPYDEGDAFVYHPEWTGALFREIGFVTRVMCQDTHTELVRAWRAINAAPEPNRSRALAVLQDMSRIDYAHTSGEIHRKLNAKDRVAEIRLASELSAWFRDHYARAEAVAGQGPK